MRKEVLFAIIAGVFVGLIVAFGVWRTNSVLQNKNTESQKQEKGNSEKKTEPDEIGLSIANLVEGDVVTESPTTISGITAPHSWVAISSDDEDFILQADETGAFETEVELSGGINQLLYLSIDPDSRQAFKLSQTIVYSTEFEDELGEQIPSETPSQDEATESGSSIRDRVKEKIEIAKRNPKAYIGSITDKTQNSLQIRNRQDEIRLVSVENEEVSIVTINDTTTPATFDEVAIGDFVVAMGFINENDVLEAVRILLTDPFEAPSRKLHFGNVVSIQDRIITIDTNGGSSFNFPTRWKGPEIDEIKESDQVIIGSTQNKNEETIIRTIQVLGESSSPDSEEDEK